MSTPEEIALEARDERLLEQRAARQDPQTGFYDGCVEDACWNVEEEGEQDE